jgi:hypothetical protein
MKNSKTILIAFLIALSLLFNQSLVKAQTFEKGDAVLNIGIGAGSAYGLATGASVWPGVNASLEYGVYQLKKVGVFSIGGITSWQHAWSGYTGNDVTWNEFYFGARSAFHLSILEVDNLDVYGGITLGIRSHSEPVWDPHTNRDVNHYKVDPFGGLFVGGRWYFTPSFGVFSELGYDVSWLKAGISLKF